MYYIFREEIVSWRNQILQAKLENPEPKYEIQENFWKGDTLVNIPKMTFSINEKAPLLDNYFTGRLFWLFSARLVSIFKDFGVAFELFPTIIIDRKTKNELPVEYMLFHLMQFGSGLDDYLFNDKVNQGLPMFRIQESPDLVVINENLKNAISQTGITGCNIAPLNQKGLGVLAFLRKKRGNL